MGKLKTMTQNVKTRYNKRGQDICARESCGAEIMVGDKYATTGHRNTSGHRHVYCETCAKFLLIT